MSFAYQQAAWDLLPGELTPQERVVLLALAEDCRTGRDVCSPGHKVLTARTGLGRTQLSTTIARLVARGLVSLAERARRGKHAVYRLLFGEAERSADRTQSTPTGTDHGSESVRQIGTIPGSASPRKNIPTRKRAGAAIASKIRRPLQPWQEPANLPDTPVRTFIPPRQGTGAAAPDWAVTEARQQMAGKVCSPLMLAALARSIAGAAA